MSRSGRRRATANPGRTDFDSVRAHGLGEGMPLPNPYGVPGMSCIQEVKVLCGPDDRNRQLKQGRPPRGGV